MEQVSVSPIQWVTLIGVFSTMIGMLAFFIKMLDRSRSHGERIGKQEEKNESYTKDIEDNKKAIKAHDESDKEYKLKTNNELTKIFKITTKLETQNEAIMKKLDI